MCLCIQSEWFVVGLPAQSILFPTISYYSYILVGVLYCGWLAPMRIVCPGTHWGCTQGEFVANQNGLTSPPRVAQHLHANSMH